MELIEQLKRDYVHHGKTWGNIAYWAVLTYRVGRWSETRPQPFRWLGGKVYGAMFLFVEITSGITLHREARIGRDCHLVHAGNIKVHPGCVIGDRVGIMQDVTLGEGERPGAPVIGDDVFIGAGAKVLGPIHIGNGARIAANSLVITDVPDGATAIGVPARILTYSGRQPGVVQTAVPDRARVVGGR
jgi:serine O-acetyltransferase